MLLNEALKSIRERSELAIAPFDIALIELSGAGQNLISLAERAELAMEIGLDSPIALRETYTREGLICIPGGEMRLARISPILDSPGKVVRAYKRKEEFYLTDKQVREALVDSFEFPESLISIDTEKFGETELIVFMFGGRDKAKKYGDFLKMAEIDSLHISGPGREYVNSLERPFVRQMHSSGFSKGSWSYRISANNRDLDSYVHVRGIKKSK